MEIHELLREHVKRDYHTANIKAEVMLDTILTPVISDIMTIIGQENRDIGIVGEIRLLAKEFPILNNPILEESVKEKKKSDYRNCNADYLMCDDESVYFVELKTTYKSFNYQQCENYIKHMYECAKDTFGNTAGKKFIKLLSHVYKFSEKSDEWAAQGEDGLKELFKTITEEEDNYVEEAIAYLRRKKAVSSRKYLLTAAQMLEHMEEYNWWNFKQIKLIYLVPEIPSDKRLSNHQIDKKDIIFVTFHDIIEKTDVIKAKIEKPDLKDYWEWVVKILEDCGLNDFEK